MIDVLKLVENADEKHRALFKEILSVALEVEKLRCYRTTGFLDQDQMTAVREALDLVYEVDKRPYGGYRGAIRCKLAVFPTGLTDDSYDPSISYFRMICSDDVEIDQFYIGLRRASILTEDVGDVFKTSVGIEGVISKNALDLLIDNDFEVDGRLFDIVEIDQTEVNFPGQKEREIKATVASLRLDSIASSGFGASRTRMAEEIKASRVKVNGTVVSSSSAKVCEKDVIVAKGRGRILVDEIKGETKKGRIYVVIKKYIMG